MVRKIFLNLFVLVCVLFGAGEISLSFSQSAENSWVTFHPSLKQNLGFYVAPSDTLLDQNDNFHSFGKTKNLPCKILAFGKSDVVRVQLHGDTIGNWSEIEFYYGKEKLIPQIKSKTTAILVLKNPKISYDLLAFLRGKQIGHLKTMVYPEKTKKLVVVPVSNLAMNTKLMEQRLKKVYKQANISLQIRFDKPFQSKVYSSKTLFGTPDSSLVRYTGQMRLLRDQYFKQFPAADKNAFYLFVIPGFYDSSENGFMIKNKAVGFVPFQIDQHKLAILISKTLAKGLGGLEDFEKTKENLLSNNLMDSTYGTELTPFQITELQREFTSYTRIDAYENVKTENGTIAYYFWKEDAKGNVVWDGKNYQKALHQPFKKNFLAYRFDVKYAWMRPFFQWGKYYISALNVLFILLLLFLHYWIRRLLKIVWHKQNWKPIWLKILFIMNAGLILLLANNSFNWGNQFLEIFKKVSGPMPELANTNYKEASQKLFRNPDIRKQSEANICSEILINKKQAWQLKKRAKVLYFEIVTDNSRNTSRLRFVSSSDSLTLVNEKFSAFARTHYTVFTHKTENGEILRQEVFRYGNLKVENIQLAENPPRRILVFANGYRPTSTSGNFGESFKKIQSNGLEFPNSNNYIYNFDRYDYWQPWNEINLQFQNRINASFTYYADGHHSVSTSDYKSLIHFTKISQLYPLRCKNPKKHNCRRVKNDNITRFLLPTTKTENLLKMAPNSKGFAYRKKKGRIAGMNLLQELNALPNQSENDTLYLVAHSMGFAYSLGIVEVLRGKINFGGFYILAPENAKSGRVYPTEWQQIWQYGSRFNLTNSDAPCLQDGVAPQSAAKGLPYENRVFIPEKNYSKKGFFDSHFIGYYTWILNLPEGEKGFVKRN